MTDEDPSPPDPTETETDSPNPPASEMPETDEVTGDDDDPPPPSASETSDPPDDPNMMVDPDLDEELEQPEGTVPIILGVGTGWETVRSCDNGKTWSAGTAIENGACEDDGDCSHDPGRAMGLAYTNGWFVAPYGNDPSQEMQIRRTQDGVTWEKVYDKSSGGIMVGKDVLVTASSPPYYSQDAGETWSVGPEFDRIQGANNARLTKFIPYDGGRFLIYFDTAESRDVVISEDGVNFVSNGQFPQECQISDWVYADGVLLTIGRGGTSCQSDDGAQSWAVSSVTLEGESQPKDGVVGILHTGSQFMALGIFEAFVRSEAGTWTQRDPGLPMVVQAPHIQAFDGAFIADVGGNNYGITRSEDTLMWETVSSLKEHLVELTKGYALPGACP
jgi:hypothetical protein